jgi:hypothetical protein
MRSFWDTYYTHLCAVVSHSLRNKKFTGTCATDGAKDRFALTERKVLFSPGCHVATSGGRLSAIFFDAQRKRHLNKSRFALEHAADERTGSQSAAEAVRCEWNTNNDVINTWERTVDAE